MSDDQIEQSMLYFVNKDIQLIKKTCSFQLHNNCRIRSNHYSEVILGSTYGYLKGKVTSKLGFELNTNFEDPEELKTLSEDLVSTHKNIIKGAVLLGQISSVGIEQFAKPGFLYVYETNADSIDQEKLSRSYYLLSLIDIAWFEEIYFDSSLQVIPP